MLEGLAQSYLEALSQTLRPADDYYWAGREAPRRSTTSTKQPSGPPRFKSRS